MIQVDNLLYTYHGSATPAVRGVSFAVDAGEIFGFLGPSGAGKSTTQKVLIKLLAGYEGEANVLGRTLDEWGADYYERIGVSFELPNHYGKLSALENLNLFRALYSRQTLEPEALLEQVGLADAAQTRVAEFSKGMKMRLNFVRALLHKPDLLFLDEPTTGMDPVNARTIKDLILAQKAQGRTVFLTTHDMTVADQLCDRVAFIVGGQIALIDSPHALKLQHSHRRLQVEYLSGDGVDVDKPRVAEFDLEGLGENAQFLALIREKTIQTLHTQEATLEEVFIETTGHPLGGAPDA